MKNVTINLNDEAGEDWFSISPEDDFGNWIDSFYSADDAKKYCQENDLKIVAFYNNISIHNSRHLYLYGRYDELKSTNFFEIGI